MKRVVIFILLFQYLLELTFDPLVNPSVWSLSAATVNQSLFYFFNLIKVIGQPSFSLSKTDGSAKIYQSDCGLPVELLEQISAEGVEVQRRRIRTSNTLQRVNHEF